jgi:hypothetical protein
MRLAREGDISVDLQEVIRHEANITVRLHDLEGLVGKIQCRARAAGDEELVAMIHNFFVPVKTGTSVCAHGTPTDQRCILC